MCWNDTYFNDNFAKLAEEMCWNVHHRLRPLPYENKIHCLLCGTRWDVADMARDPTTSKAFCINCWVTVTVPNRNRSPIVQCSKCNTTWIIDNMDREGHTPSPYCKICEKNIVMPSRDTPGASSSTDPREEQCGLCTRGLLPGQEVANVSSAVANITELQSESSIAPTSATSDIATNDDATHSGASKHT